MAKRKRKQALEEETLEEVVDALFAARDTDKIQRLLKPLTPDERKEVWKKWDERQAATKERFREAFKKAGVPLPE